MNVLSRPGVLNLPRLSSVAGLVAATVFGLVGCGQDTTSPPPTSNLSYHRDAVVVLDRYCTSCHKAGGIAPFSLTDYESVSRHASLIREAVGSGRMPPWMPSDQGVPLRYSRAMPKAHKDLLLSWLDGGAQRGDVNTPARTDIPALEMATPPRPDITLDPGVTYQPNRNLADDYRCFVMDLNLTEDTFISAGDIKPGNPAVVHHVIAYEVPARDVAKIRTKDQAEPGPGYTCFGGPGATAQTVLVWAPGSVPMRTPENLAVKLTKGSIMVVQVHYNLSNDPGAGDRTLVHLEKAAQAPQKIAVLFGIAQPDKLIIKANDAKATQQIRIPILAAQIALKLPNITIYGNVPHMHTLGKRITTRVEGGDLLVDLPRWDFHWQQYYQFQKPYEMRSQDTLLVECEYDNSPNNQPVINGQKQVPKDVTWGEGTRDEMCLSYVQLAMDPATAL